MKPRSSTRLGIVILGLIVTIVFIGGVAFLVRALFGGQETPAEILASSLLTNPTANTTVSMTVRGPITAKEYHYDLKLEISATSRRLVAYKGYNQNEEIGRLDLDNDDKSFRDLLLALQMAGYTNQIKSSDERSDGLCATGQIISFGLADGETVSSELWTTSCGGSGDFGGNAQAVIDLLMDQIPGSTDVVRQAKTLGRN